MKKFYKVLIIQLISILYPYLVSSQQKAGQVDQFRHRSYSHVKADAHYFNLVFRNSTINDSIYSFVYSKSAFKGNHILYTTLTQVGDEFLDSALLKDTSCVNIQLIKNFNTIITMNEICYCLILPYDLTSGTIPSNWYLYNDKHELSGFLYLTNASFIGDNGYFYVYILLDKTSHALKYCSLSSRYKLSIMDLKIEIDKLNMKVAAPVGSQ